MRRFATAALVAAVLLGTAACGLDEGANASNTPALAGPPPSGSPHMALAPGESGDKPVRRIGVGAFVRSMRTALATRRGVHLDLEIRTPRITVTGKADEHLHPGPAALRMEVATSYATAPNVDVIQTQRAMWLSVQGYTPPGKWTSVDTATSGGVFGPDSAIISHELDPVSALLANRAGFERWRFLGPDSLYGVPMAHYRLKVDSRRALAARGASAGLQALMPDTLVYDVWLDRRRLISRIKVDVEKLRIDVELSDWGKRVHVRTPDPADLVSLPQPS
ncbi:MAG: hypothetical protein HOQ22_03060 [Nocardioidaceae bacterium]|nr:hypothetical protein [Nocardioidaceae bacterium]NUS50005.1 hypothetical protein [Nocardioidaceae bacterium]